MDAVVAFIANGEATKPVEPGERALDDPAEHAKAAAVGRAATAEDRNNAAGGEAITMWLRIVARSPCRTSGRRRSSARRVSCKRRQTPARSHSTKRRQHVLPEPHPISRGNICHGNPPRSTNRMPVSGLRKQRLETRPQRIVQEGLCHARPYQVDPDRVLGARCPAGMEPMIGWFGLS